MGRLSQLKIQSVSKKERKAMVNEYLSERNLTSKKLEKSIENIYKGLDLRYATPKNHNLRYAAENMRGGSETRNYGFGGQSTTGKRMRFITEIEDEDHEDEDDFQSKLHMLRNSRHFKTSIGRAIPMEKRLQHIDTEMKTHGLRLEDLASTSAGRLPEIDEQSFDSATSNGLSISHQLSFINIKKRRINSKI